MGLRFAYPGAAADTIRGLELEVADGAAHALLGASGAGKTTLLMLLSGLLEPSDGKIMLRGRDVTRVRARDRNVSQVFQFPVLYDAMTVRGNLEFPLRQKGWDRRSARDRAQEIAGELDIVDLLDRRPDSLSLFQKQLTAIGRAVVRPDIQMVLLDEPLTAVEPAVKWRLRRTLRRLQRQLGMTMVYVTHDQTEALTFADTVSVIADGHLLQTGSCDEVVNEPTHTTVAAFVGDPGMNLIDGTVRDQRVYLGPVVLGSAAISDGPVVVGFRAEWARTSPGGALQGRILAQHPKTVAGGQVRGLARVELEDGAEVQVPYISPVNDGLAFELDRFALFREQQRVG